MEKVPLWETHQSNFELTSNEKVDSMGVIASSAVCSQKLDCQRLRILSPQHSTVVIRILYIFIKTASFHQRPAKFDDKFS